MPTTKSRVGSMKLSGDRSELVIAVMKQRVLTSKYNSCVEHMHPSPHDQFMRRAIALSLENATSHAGGPFGAVVVKDGTIIGEGCNRVTSTNDPTAHAEVVAIRAACAHLGTFQLTGATIYTSCEPCPMCLAAIYWARIEQVYYANTKSDAAAIQFDDQFIEQQLRKPIEARAIAMTQLLRDEAQGAFVAWANSPNKTPY